MALTDSERALLLLHEYRYHTEQRVDVKAKNDAAGEIILETSLNEAQAVQLANKIADDNENPRLISAEIEGLIWLDFFEGGPPQFALTMERDALDKAMKGISVKCSFSSGTSILEVRG